MESCVSVSEFSSLEELLESVPAVEVVPMVPMDVHEKDKNKEDSDKVSDEGSDEVFPDKTLKGKNKKKRERTGGDCDPSEEKSKKISR